MISNIPSTTRISLAEQFGWHEAKRAFFDTQRDLRDMLLLSEPLMSDVTKYTRSGGGSITADELDAIMSGYKAGIEHWLNRYRQVTVRLWGLRMECDVFDDELDEFRMYIEDADEVGRRLTEWAREREASLSRYSWIDYEHDPDGRRVYEVKPEAFNPDAYNRAEYELLDLWERPLMDAVGEVL